MPETKIVKYETIIVKDARKNDYGDLVVNGGIRISKKRENLFSLFQPGAEVKLGYGNYMSKDYVATAEQTGKHEIPQEPSQPPPESVQSKSTPIKGDFNDRTRGIALSYAVTLTENGTCPIGSIGSLSQALEKYMLNQISASQLDSQIGLLLK